MKKKQSKIKLTIITLWRLPLVCTVYIIVHTAAIISFPLIALAMLSLKDAVYYYKQITEL